jgi:hypothetical protein
LLATAFATVEHADEIVLVDAVDVFEAGLVEPSQLIDEECVAVVSLATFNTLGDSSFGGAGPAYQSQP